MRRILIPALGLALLCALAVNADASAIGLLDPYQVNLLEDVDYESGVIFQDDDPETPPRTTLATGDLLYGMYLIDGVQSETGPNTGAGLRKSTTHTFTGVFLVEVASAEQRDSDNKWVYYFKPVAPGVWSTLFGPTLVPTAAHTISIAYDDNDAPNHLSPSAGANAFAAMLTAADGDELWEFGFPGGLDDDGVMPVDTDLFWRAVSETNDLLDLIDEPLNDDDLPRLTYRASMDVTEYSSGIALLPHNWKFDDFWSDLQLVGRLQDGDAGHFGLLTDSEFFIVPTPEPGTFALLGLGLVGFGAAVLRRRRKA